MAKKKENRQNEESVPLFKSRGKNSTLITILTIIIFYLWYAGFFDFLNPLGTTLKTFSIFTLWLILFIAVEMFAKKSTLKYWMSDRDMKNRLPLKKREHKDPKEKKK